MIKRLLVVLWLLIPIPLFIVGTFQPGLTSVIFSVYSGINASYYLIIHFDDSDGESDINQEYTEELRYRMKVYNQSTMVAQKLQVVKDDLSPVMNVDKQKRVDEGLEDILGDLKEIEDMDTYLPEYVKEKR